MNGGGGTKRTHGDVATSSQATMDTPNSRQRKEDEIRSDVTNLVKENPEGVLEELYDRWELDATHLSMEDFTRRALTNLGVPSDADISLDRPTEYGLRQLDEAIMRHEMQAIALYQALRQRDPQGEKPELQIKATKIIEMVYYAKRVVLSAFQARLAVHQLHCTDIRLADDLDKMLGSWTLRFKWFDWSKSTALQKLLLHLLDTAMERRYRKQNGYVYEPILVDGYETHAWRQVCEMKEFVYEATRKELHWEQWENLTASGNNARMAVEHLSCANDFQFPFLNKDRTVFSFRNGVYLAREDRFCRFGAGGEPVSDSVVAARFIDADLQTFDELDDWRDIPTPRLHSIMDYQEWPADVCDWMYILLGRLLYNVGERDGWQVIPFMHGQASSGKSTIVLKVAKMFYEPADVGVLSNNVERQFGISAFWDKLLFCGPEIKGDLKIEQAEFQSIVSGESVQVAAKHKKAFTVEWNTPGILAGNEVPNFTDNAGSVQRRLLVFSFLNTVVNGDMKLADKLAAELPSILLKCNRAYLEASHKWGSRNVWTVLPDYFQNTREEMAQAVNSIEAFLASQDVTIGADLCCLFDDFRDAWRSFSVANGYTQHTKGPTTHNLFRTPFEKHGIRVEKNVTREHRGASKRGTWVIGADVAASQDNGFALG